MSVVVRLLTGADLGAGLPALAGLRIDVFRAWPYLYDGTLDYEASYLRKFAAAAGAVIVVAVTEDGEEIAGCATAMPMASAEPAFSHPFRARGLDTSKIFYCGESVLRSPFRGQGIGHKFFDLREAAARAAGATLSAFCAVVRPAEHPLRDPDYVPLDSFWRKRGYAPVEGLTTTFTWTDVGETSPTRKTMQFWTKAL